MTAIVMRNLSKRYRADGPLAVNDVSMEVGDGEIVCLLGPNGAGKTTLIALLACLLRPTSGEALVAGHSVVHDSIAARRCIGLVPQEVALYPQITARRNLHYFGGLQGLRGRRLAEATDEALAWGGLTERADEQAATLSGGLKRRLNIAVGLLHRPPILLLDEPTVGLDPASRRSILDLLSRLRREAGITILFATHSLAEAEELSDRVAILHQGRLVALDTPAALLAAADCADTVRLHIAPGNATAAALAAVRGMVEEASPSALDDVLTLTVERAHAHLPAILAAVAGAGVEVLALTVSKPGLESVFLRLTGDVFE